MLVSAVIVQFTSAIDAPGAAPFGSEPLPMNALLAYGVVLGFCWCGRRFGGRLLNRHELLVVIYSLLISGILFCSGFWRYMLQSARTAAACADQTPFTEGLWPRGADALAGRLAAADAPGLTILGDVAWIETELRDGARKPIPVIANTDPQGTGSVRVRIPVREGGRPPLVLGSIYRFSLSVRPVALGPESRYFARLYLDDAGWFDSELLSTRLEGRLAPDGRREFASSVLESVEIPAYVRDSVTVEIGLIGRGKIEIGGASLIDSWILATAVSGRRLVSGDQYAALPPEQRAPFVPLPKRLLSWDGLRFVVDGYVPWRAWAGPIARWAAFAGLILTASFGISCLFRRQWLQNERFPLPHGQVVAGFLGHWNDSKTGAPLWVKRAFWAGAIFAFIWYGSMILRVYFPGVPAPSFGFSVKTYLAQPAWARTWEGIQFDLKLPALALALMMELNVAGSMVIGFLLARMQHRAGEAFGMAGDREFPRYFEQISGAVIAYGLLIVVFTRRYLAGAIRRALVPDGRAADEVLSPRGSLALIAFSLVGAGLWAYWVHLPLAPVLAFFAALVLVALAVARIRAECGVPVGQFPGQHARPFLGSLVAVLGGYGFFGVSGLLFAGLVTLILCSGTTFWHLPGIQTELVALGQKHGARRSDIIGTALLGCVGGFVIGGWVYLNSLHSIGADNYTIGAYYWANQGPEKLLQTELSRFEYGSAAGHPDHPAAGGGSGYWRPNVAAFAAGAGVTTALAVLRQAVAGFWFHPVGYILGPLLEGVWGSLLIAWCARFLVLKIWGAAAVRDQLVPGAIGIFAGTAAAAALMVLLQAAHYFFKPTAQHFNGVF